MFSVSSLRPRRNQKPSSSRDRPVAVDPGPRPASPVRVEVPLGIAPDAARHRRPRLCADQLADLVRARGGAVGSPDVHVHPERRSAERARLQLGDRQRGQEARADLGAARQVDDRTASARPLRRTANDTTPGPRARRSRRGSASVDRSCARTGPVPSGMRARISVGETPRVVTPWRSTSDPEAVGPGMGRRPLVQQDGRAERERADDLPRPHDPSEVGRPVQDLARVQVHLVGDLLRDLHEEAAVDVHDAFRPARRPARVADEQRLLRVERLGVERRVVVEPGPVDVARRIPRGRDVRQPAPHHDPLDAAGERGGPVGGLLHGHGLPFAERGVRGQEHGRARVRQPRADRVGAEPAEDRHPDRTELRARHHGGDRLRRHRQEDADRRGGPDAERRRPRASRSVSRRSSA